MGCTKDQSYGDSTYVQRTNPLGTCACAKDQSDGNTMYVQSTMYRGPILCVHVHVLRTNPMGTRSGSIYRVTKDQFYGNTIACTKAQSYGGHNVGMENQSMGIRCM